MKKEKRLKKKLLIFLPIGVYFITGFILCSCLGCSSLQETLELRSPFIVSDQAYNANLGEDESGNVRISLFYESIGETRVRYLDLETGNWDREKGYGTPEKPVPFVEIKTNLENCKSLMNSQLELKEFWDKNRQILLQQDRTRIERQPTWKRDNLGRMTYKEKVIPINPYYSNKAEFSEYYSVSCNKFETAEISWDKLPDNAILALIERTDNEKYRDARLYIKRYGSDEWLRHDLGIPCSSTARFSIKVCNALLLPVSIPCAFIYDLITASAGIPH